MTNSRGKENVTSPSSGGRRPNRRVEADLRRRVLREQTCKQLFFDASRLAASLEEQAKHEQSSEVVEVSSKARLQGQRLTCEEKVVQVRRKLEKIVHRRESNEAKALGYLSTLDKMKISQQVVLDTKVDLVIEALRLVAVEEAVRQAAEATLQRLKSEAIPEDRVQIKEANRYRDPKAEAKRASKSRDQKGGETSKNLPKKYTATSSLLALAENTENIQTKETEVSAEVHVTDSLPSMRLGYWMERLESGVEKLSLLDQQVGKITQQLEEEKQQQQLQNSEEDDDEDSAEEDGLKKADEKGKRRNAAIGINSWESELLQLTATVSKIAIGDAAESHETASSDKTRENIYNNKKKILTLSEYKQKKDDGSKATSETDSTRLVDSTSVLEEAVRLGKELEAAVEDDKQLNILKALAGLPMSLAVLQLCSIGLAVNRLRKRSSNGGVVDAATVLVKQWKKLVLAQNDEKQEDDKASDEDFGLKDEAGAGKSNTCSLKAGTGEDNKKDGVAKPSDTGKKTSLKGGALFNRKENVGSGAKEGTGIKLGAKSSEAAKSKAGIISDADSDGSSANAKNKSAPSEKVGTAAVPCVKHITEDCAKDGAEAKDTESIRKHCRSLLATALAANTSLPISCCIPTDQLAWDIEAEIFELFKETSNKYRSQVNSRYFNLKQNRSLQENLLLGNVSPRELATMSYEEMASDQVREARERYEQESRQQLTAPVNHVGDGFCTCRLCMPPWILNN